MQSVSSSNAQSQREDEEEGSAVSLTVGDLDLDAPLLQPPAITSSQSSSNDNEKKRYSPLRTLIEIYSDQSGSCQNLTTGLSIVFFLGAVLGIIMPKNPALPHPIYQYLSSIVGYTYFVSWSVSYYPQIITIAQRRTSEGLSTDSSVLAFVNYTCYAVYNAFFFWSDAILKEYKHRHGEDAEITVQSNDVAFALHALFLTLLLLGQIVYYGGFTAYPISNLTKIILGGVMLTCAAYIACIYIYGWQWIDFLYLMASIKLILTILTYLPQLHLNYTRKSTVGWNIWQVVFDCTGGVLSLLQLVWDSIDMDDLYHGILGNWAKLVLSLITLVCDGAFFAQHIIYNDGESDDSSFSEREEEISISNYSYMNNEDE